MPSLTTRTLSLYIFLALFSTVALSKLTYLTGDQIRETIIDYTLIGNDWAEYYSPEGEISGRARFLGFTRNYLGHWKIKKNTICYTYEDSQFNTCSKLERNADRIIHYHLNGTQKNDGEARRISGNQIAQL